MAMPDDWPHIFKFPETEKWRVKLCRLGEESWNVFGEGLIHGVYDENTDEYSLVVQDIEDPLTCLFNTTIKSPVAFQKQDTILLWNGPEDDVRSEATELSDWRDEDGLTRIAIGFQAAAGCASVSDFILYAASQTPEEAKKISFTVQCSSSSNDSSFEDLADTIEKPLVLPPLPNKFNLTIALNNMSALLNSQFGREMLIVYLDSKHYLDCLYSVFTEVVSGTNSIWKEPGGVDNNSLQTNGDMHGNANISTKPPPPPLSQSSPTQSSLRNDDHGASDGANMSTVERIQTLWTISDIVKQYCLIGDNYLIEEMITAEKFPKILNMLEYDRAFGTRKATFKDFYSNHTGFKQVFEITDTPVVEKIRRTFRLQLLRDVLVRSADDFTFHILRTLIYVNHSEILEKLQSSPEFCDNLFGLFDQSPYHPSNATTQTMNDAIRFIYEIMKTSKTFAYTQLKSLYHVLIDSGLINAINYGVSADRDDTIKIMSLESLSTIVDFDISLILPFYESLIRNIMRLAADQDMASRSPFISPSTRSVLIEMAENLKKLLLELPAETMPLFFKHLGDILGRTSSSNKLRKSAVSLSFLEILISCFSFHPEITGTLMIENEIWDKLSQIYSTDDGRDSADIGAPQQSGGTVAKSDHLRAQESMALIRLIREAIQPPVVTSTLRCAEQARRILNSGLFPKLLKGHIYKYMQRNVANDAEKSSFLNLMYTIVEGWSHTTAQQYRVIANWMADEGQADVKLLAEEYHFLSALLPDHFSSLYGTSSILKRLSASQDVRPASLGHTAQRLRLATPSATSSTASSRQHVDEVDEVDDDTFVLPPSSFANHYKAETLEKLLHSSSHSAAEPPIDKLNPGPDGINGDYMKHINSEETSRDVNSAEHTDNFLMERMITEKSLAGDVPDDTLADTAGDTAGDAATNTSSAFSTSPVDSAKGAYMRHLSTSPPPPPHPWWDSPKMRHGISSPQDFTDKVSLLQPGIRPETMSGSPR